MSYAVPSFPFLPYGGLSKTLKTFHPSKLSNDNNVARNEDTPGRLILRGPFQGAVIERTFEVRNSGFKPLNWGNFDISFSEYDPIFGEARFHYTMNAAKVLINPSTSADVIEIEERLAHQLRHSSGPLRLKMVADVLGKERPARGKVRISHCTAETATVIDPDEDMGSAFFLEPDVSLAPHFCFHHAFDRILDVDYEVSPDNLSVKLSAQDDHGFTQKVNYLFARTTAGKLTPFQITLELRKASITAQLQVNLSSHFTIPQLQQRHFGFRDHLEHHAQRYSEKYTERIIALSDGTMELVRVKRGDRMGLTFAFFANLKDGNGERVELALSPALAVPLVGEAIEPSLLHYNGRFYSIIYGEGKLTLIDSETREKYEGGYRNQSVADFEVGNIPMLHFSIRGLPGVD